MVASRENLGDFGLTHNFALARDCKLTQHFVKSPTKPADLVPTLVVETQVVIFCFTDRIGKLGKPFDRRNHVSISQKSDEKPEQTKTSDQQETEQTLTAQIVYALHQQLIETLLRGFPGIEASIDSRGICRGRRPGRSRASPLESLQCIKKHICVRAETGGRRLDRLFQFGIRISALRDTQIVRDRIRVCAQQRLRER